MYHFIDGQLYKITAHVKHRSRGRGYEEVKRALLKKYGSPFAVEKVTHRNGFGTEFSGKVLRWSNQISTIELNEYNNKISLFSLVIHHEKLNSKVEQRAPSPRVDDL